MASTKPSTDTRRPIVGVSTKMYFSLARTAAFVDSTISLLSSPSSPSLSPLSCIDAFIVPDFVSLPTVVRAVSTAPPPADRLLVGAQDCAARDFGPLTGEVSPAVLREAGCRIVEVGHAERRRLFGETDADVRDKAAAVLRNGMVPLVCVGEASREGGVEGAVSDVVQQVGAVLEGLDATAPGAEVVVAYEPVWAIGAAEPAGAEYVREVVRRVRESPVLQADSWKGRVRIVYGGAAGPGLWGRLNGEVDGLFIGRFGHQPEQFVGMLYEVAGMERQS
ncbi:putative triosephosphate isomerase [Madurella mycetomatis]|uniref:Triosephosphate isomerase n=1 Tax=Madurella mycetomatis TaxID=100816 RepID=A0A175WAP2_9PEZI|nr:putative triosephosphate isomerase [Madurella mycetomatis]